MDEKNLRTEVERSWAESRFRDYLFHRLSEEEDERLHAGLSLIPGLNAELDEAEAKMIREGLDEKLAGPDRQDFENYYVNGGESNRVKVTLERCLRVPEARVPVPGAARPVKVWRYLAAAAALLLASLGGVAIYQARQRVAQLDGEVAKLKVELEARQKGENVNPNRERPERVPERHSQPEERQAGEIGIGGLVLPAGQLAARLMVLRTPARLIWRPVPDYRADYRIRIRAADGQEQTSAVLTAKNYAIEYEPENAAAWPLPWEVTVLDGDATVGRYTVSQR